MISGAQVLVCAVLIFTLGGRMNATTLSYNLIYTDLGRGPSFGSGEVTIDESVLTPNNFDFTDVPASFIDSFSLTFFNFPDNGPISFSLSNLGAVVLTTDDAGNINDINFWSYDRIGLGTNTCPPCSEPYLAGIMPFTGTLTDPVHNNALVIYNIDLVPIAVPEASSFSLLSAAFLGASASLLGRKLFGRT